MLIKKAEARRGQGILKIMLTKELYWKGKERRRNIGKSGEQRVTVGDTILEKEWRENIGK